MFQACGQPAGVACRAPLVVTGFETREPVPHVLWGPKFVAGKTPRSDLRPDHNALEAPDYGRVRPSEVMPSSRSAIGS